MFRRSSFFFFFFFNDTATTEIYTLSLHDALPILERRRGLRVRRPERRGGARHDRRRSLRGVEQPALAPAHQDAVGAILQRIGGAEAPAGRGPRDGQYVVGGGRRLRRTGERGVGGERLRVLDRKSTRLNSSHSQISYAVFCLKKKKKQTY